MSLNEIKKESQFAGKGHNVIFEIAILMKHMRAAKNDIDGHVSGNGGTCQVHKIMNGCFEISHVRNCEIR